MDDYKFPNKTTYIVHGWMINEMNLSGFEIPIFAIIFGFSQDGKSKFYGSITYLMAATGASKNTVLKCLNNLQNTGFISKYSGRIKGIDVNFYQQTIDENYKPIGSSNLGSSNFEPVQNLGLGSSNFEPNNNIYNNNVLLEKEPKDDLLFPIDNLKNQKEENKKETRAFEKIDWEKLREYYNKVFGRDIRVVPDKAKKQFNQRIKEGYTKADIVKVIDNAKGDNFHAQNGYKACTLDFLSKPDKFAMFVAIPHKKTIIEEQKKSGDLFFNQ